MLLIPHIQLVSFMMCEKKSIDKIAAGSYSLWTVECIHLNIKVLKKYSYVREDKVQSADLYLLHAQ